MFRREKWPAERGWVTIKNRGDWRYELEHETPIRCGIERRVFA